MRLLTPQESHEQSLFTLNALYEYDDFMDSINTLVDLGCGDGQDLEWWATRTTRDDRPRPLNIKCTGIDMINTPAVAHKHRNITYQRTNFEGNITAPINGFNVLWCNNAFQYATNPLQTLSNWWEIASNDAMLAMLIPQTTNFQQALPEFNQPTGCYYHYTLVNLIHMLAVSGWDCRSGFFLVRPNDPWIRVIVYKSKHAPMPPGTTSFHDLIELELLPESAVKCIRAHGEIRQQELVLPWIDQNLTWYGKR